MEGSMQSAVVVVVAEATMCFLCTKLTTSKVLGVDAEVSVPKGMTIGLVSGGGGWSLLGLWNTPLM